MAKIQISENESLREAIRRFKKMCDKEGIINQSKRYAYFEQIISDSKKYIKAN
jgi:small subunit ribosomal protein S21